MRRLRAPKEAAVQQRAAFRRTRCRGWLGDSALEVTIFFDARRALSRHIHKIRVRAFHSSLSKRLFCLCSVHKNLHAAKRSLPTKDCTLANPHCLGGDIRFVLRFSQRSVSAKDDAPGSLRVRLVRRHSRCSNYISEGRCLYERGGRFSGHGDPGELIDDLHRPLAQILCVCRLVHRRFFAKDGGSKLHKLLSLSPFACSLQRSDCLPTQ